MGAGGCHPQPDVCSDALYAVLKTCWAINHHERPQFSDLIASMSKVQFKPNPGTRIRPLQARQTVATTATSGLGEAAYLQPGQDAFGTAQTRTSELQYGVPVVRPSSEHTDGYGSVGGVGSLRVNRLPPVQLHETEESNGNTNTVSHRSLQAGSNGNYTTPDTHSDHYSTPDTHSDHYSTPEARPTRDLQINIYSEEGGGCGDNDERLGQDDVASVSTGPSPAKGLDAAKVGLKYVGDEDLYAEMDNEALLNQGSFVPHTLSKEETDQVLLKKDAHVVAQQTELPRPPCQPSSSEGRTTVSVSDAGVRLGSMIPFPVNIPTGSTQRTVAPMRTALCPAEEAVDTHATAAHQLLHGTVSSITIPVAPLNIDQQSHGNNGRYTGSLHITEHPFVKSSVLPVGPGDIEPAASDLINETQC